MDRAARKEPCDVEGIVVSKDYPITKIPDSHAEKKIGEAEVGTIVFWLLPEHRCELL